VIVSRYIDASTTKTGGKRAALVMACIGIIVVMSSALLFAGFRIDDRSNIMVGVSIVTALMCAVAVLIFQIRQTTMRDDQRLVSRDNEAVDDLFSIVLWLISVGLFLALYLLLPDFLDLLNSGMPNAIYSWLGFSMHIHFTVVLGQFITRFTRLYDRVASRKGTVKNLSQKE